MISLFAPEVNKIQATSPVTCFGRFYSQLNFKYSKESPADSATGNKTSGSMIERQITGVWKCGKQLLCSLVLAMKIDAGLLRSKNEKYIVAVRRWNTPNKCIIKSPVLGSFQVSFLFNRNRRSIGTYLSGFLAWDIWNEVAAGNNVLISTDRNSFVIFSQDTFMFLLALLLSFNRSGFVLAKKNGVYFYNYKGKSWVQLISFLGFEIVMGNELFWCSIWTSGF